MSNQKNSAQEQLNESLSALVDGEATEIELRRILKSEDPALMERWSRYHLARDAMQGKVDLPVNIDLSAAISAAIAEEPVYSSQPAKQKKATVWSNIGRFAVAASVAGAVVLGVQFAPNTGFDNVADSGSPVSATPNQLPSSPVLTPDTSLRAVGNQVEPQQKPIVINEETRQQLKRHMENKVNRFMLEHAQDGAQNTQQGILPYVRVPDAEQ